MTLEDEARAVATERYDLTRELATSHAHNDRALRAQGFVEGYIAGASRQPSDAIPSHPDADYTPEVFEKMQALLVEASGSPMLALRLVLSRQPSEVEGSAKLPQNSTVSDAEVEAALKVLGDEGFLPTNVYGNEHYEGYWRDVAKMALEAARTARGEQK